MHDAPVNCDLAIWRGSQVVRSRSAKPLFAGSIPAPASPNADRFVSVKVVSGKTGTADKISPAARAARPCSTAFWPLPWHAGRRLLGRVLKQIVSYHNHIAAKWRRWFDRKARAQNGQRLRRKRNGNDYEYYCIFHVLRSYPNQPDLTSLIVMDFEPLVGHGLGKHHMMVEASRKRTSGADCGIGV